MSQQTPVLEPKNPVPPEERFWKRYSPHHEFPLSSVGSVVLHVLSVGALIVVGYVLTRTDGTEQSGPPLIGVVAVSNLPKGGGDQEAIRDDPRPPRKADVAKDANPPQPGSKLPEAVKLKDVEMPKIRIRPSPDGDRLLVGKEDQAVFSDLDGLIARTRDYLNKPTASAPRPKPGPGPGGQGGKPPGTLRQERQQRWKLFFPTTDGDDYLNQLRGLGAILAIPQPKGNGRVDYLVIRDLKPNAVGTWEDIRKLNRMFWIDNERRSVEGVAKALGLRNPPLFFVAFFPPDLEEHLRRLEQQAYSGDEGRIVETRFRVAREGERYRAMLDGDNPVELKRN